VWLAFLLSEGDHRLARVEPWGTAQRWPLCRCLGHQVKPRALTEDRLAARLDSLRVAAPGAAGERARKQSVRRVDAVPGRRGRVDPTTAAAAVTPAGLCQRGHRKAHRPDLPQVPRAMAVLAPLGWPWTRTVVAGPRAEAPRSRPAMAKGRQVARTTGLTEVGACQMAALGTRAESVAPPAASLGPLSAQPRPDAALDRGRAPVWRHALAPSASRWPPADGGCAETDAPGARGLASTVERTAPEPSGPSQTWHERRLGVRSLAWAARPEQHGRHRVARAVAALNALDERTQGQQRGPDAAAASPPAATLLAHYRVAGRGHARVPSAGHAYVKRRYGTRPATTGRRERVRRAAGSAEAPRAQAVQRLGGRGSAPTHTAAALRLAQGVAASRRAALIDHGFGRVQGRALSLTPRFLQDDHRGVALVCLVSIALRVLVLRPCGVRRNLPHVGATLTGLSPGQPGRATAPPTTARMVGAWRGVTLSRLKIDGTLLSHLTPLNTGQKRLLALMEVPLESSGGLVTRLLYFRKYRVNYHLAMTGCCLANKAAKTSFACCPRWSCSWA